MRKIYILFISVIALNLAHAQELYVFTEPASNMPAHSLSTKASATFSRNHHGLQQRYTPEVMFGFSKKVMLHVASTFSNMYSNSTRWESIYLYGKYRFLSIDEIHKHFRMAAFAEASHSRNRYNVDEVNIQGDRSGIQIGIIATQLLNRTAFSASISNVQALDESRFDKVYYTPARNYQAMNYSLSAGYLLLPREYKDYDQLNVNLYTEFLAQQILDVKGYFIDMAPAVQLIFNSNSKLNLGYRFQLSGNETRNSDKSFLVSFEHTFFNALKK